MMRSQPLKTSMPKPTAPLPDGYAVIRQPDGFKLLRCVGHWNDGAPVWQEIAGPYLRRSEAVRMAERDSKRRQSSDS